MIWILLWFLIGLISTYFLIFILIKNIDRKKKTTIKRCLETLRELFYLYIPKDAPFSFLPTPPVFLSIGGPFIIIALIGAIIESK